MVKLIPLSTGLQALFLSNAISLVEAGKYTTTEQCFTRYANVPPPRGTVRTIHHNSRDISTFTKLKSVTKTNTVTPDPTTTVVTNTATHSTEVTQIANTDTSYTDVYTGVLSIVSTTDTSLSFTSTTTSTVTSTTNVPTVVGFVPLASDEAVINAGGASRKRRRAPAFGADVLDHIDERSNHKQNTIMEFSDANPKNRTRYKVAVQCYRIVYGVKTVKVTSTSTVQTALDPKTSTETTLTTITTTNTIPNEDAITTTSTRTHTTTDTSTTSFSTTIETVSTVTEHAPTVTSYDACMENNRISKVGQAYVGYTNGRAADFNFNGPTEMECCAQAQSGDYLGFQYCPFDTPYCILFKDDAGRCDAASLFNWEFFVFNQPNGVEQTMGNGPCGRGTYSGFI